MTQSENRIHIEIDGKPFSDFYYGPDTPKPYLHPLRSASGKIVTRHFPVEKSEGDQHQRPLWIGYKLVNGFDFWENEFSYNNKNAGKVVARSVTVKDGTIRGTFSWLSPSGEAMLEETRTMTIRGEGGLRVIDVDITLRALTKTVFGDAKDGVFGVRLAEALTEKNGGLITNSRGGRTMKETWGKPAEWVDYSGEIEGEKLGVAIFEHPSSFHSPSRWHVRDYGLLAVNPFGANAFDKSLPAASSAIEPGASIKLKYRVVIHPGLDHSALGQMYQQGW